MADAEIDFIGKDKASAVIAKIQTQTEGLGTKLGTALKAGAGLFAAEKIKNFAMELARTAGESDKFKASFEKSMAAVTELKVQLGAPILGALEAIAPIVAQIAKDFERWKIPEKAESGVTKFRDVFLAMAADIGGSKNGSKMVAMLKGFEEFRDRMQKLNPKLSKEQQEKVDKELRTEQRAATLGTAENAAITRDIRALEERMRELTQKSRAAGLDKLKTFGGKLDFSGGPGNIFKDVFRGIGAAVAGGSELPLIAGKALGKAAVGKPGEAFKSSIEDFSSLFSRIQTGAASDPAKDAAKKTADNTDKMKTGIDKIAEATKGAWDALKNGVPAVAG